MFRQPAISVAMLVVLHVAVKPAAASPADDVHLARGRALIRAHGAVIRATPDVSGARVGQAFAGEAVVILARRNRWVQIEEGWIDEEDVIDPRKGIEEFSAVIQTRPGALAYACRSRAHLELGHDREGLADAERAVAMAQDCAPAWYSRSAARFAAGNLEGAEADAWEAIRLEPTWAAAYGNLGFVLASRDSYAEALTMFDSAATHGSANVCTFNCRGACHFKLGHTAQAIADFTRAIEIGRNDPEPYENRAQAYYFLGNESAALKDVNHVVELHGPSPRRLVLRANIRREQGQAEEALRDLAHALELDPKLPYAFVCRAGLYLSQSQFKEAIADANRALEITPRYAEAIGIRGSVYGAMGDLSRALQDLTQAISIEPNAEHLYSTRGVILVGLHEYARAVKDFDEAVRLGPDSALTQERYGWLLATCPDPAIRNAKRALAAATKACELSKYQDGRKLEVLAAAWAESGDFARAMRYLDLAIQLAPDDIRLERRVAAARELYRAGQPYRDEGMAYLRTL